VGVFVLGSRARGRIHPRNHPAAEVRRLGMAARIWW
jgi:hypothetical protein